PVFVDTIQVSAIAERAEKALGDRVLLLPTLWLGSSHHHLDFPGTVSVLPSLYSQMIKSVANCILDAGFKRLLFLNGHGGNKVPAAQALSELVCESEKADDAYLLLCTWWELNPETYREGMEAEGVAHACEYETSLILALRPELAAVDQIREGPMALNNDWVKTEGPGSRVSVFRRFRRLTASGSMGKPTLATAQKGKRLLEAVTNDVIRLVEELAEWPELGAIGPDSTRSKH
ncbi:MAG: creatininase family protein, partial [Candidatus Omnitrophica bacterium]|nr:creatininase family protein [Candidatus Omnitrophota bacterium]